MNRIVVKSFGLIALAFSIAGAHAAKQSAEQYPERVQTPASPKSPCRPIGRLIPVKEFPLPTRFSFPSGIADGPDGNLWFTEQGTGEGGSKIGRITPQGVITEFPTVTPASGPYGIALGADGNLWFTETYADKIGSITTAGVMKEYPLPNTGADVRYITKGPDGNMWFTETVGQRIGRITPNGMITEVSVSKFGIGSGPQGITAGPDGNLWFLEDMGPSDAVVRMTPSGTMTTFMIPNGANVLPNNITVGPDGNLWFTATAGFVGVITTAGTFLPSVPVNGPGINPTGITSDPHGVWITGWGGNRVIYVKAGTGVAGPYIPIPTAKPYLNGITIGPDGNIWFTETFGNKIGCFNPYGL